MIKAPHPKLTKAVMGATCAIAEAKAAAEYLADVMKRIHGGDWRVQIEHDVQFVMVARFVKPGRIKPKPEVA